MKQQEVKTKILTGTQCKTQIEYVSLWQLESTIDLICHIPRRSACDPNLGCMLLVPH